jgi:hypothetical protein
MGASAKGTVQTGVHIFTNQPMSAHSPHTYTAFLYLFSGFSTTQSSYAGNHMRIAKTI